MINHQASLHNLENQVGQIAKLLSKKPQGSLRSNMETNLREIMKMLTLRSGEVVTMVKETREVKKE